MLSSIVSCSKSLINLSSVSSIWSSDISEDQTLMIRECNDSHLSSMKSSSNSVLSLTILALVFFAHSRASFIYVFFVIQGASIVFLLSFFPLQRTQFPSVFTAQSLCSASYFKGHDSGILPLFEDLGIKGIV